MHGMPDKSSGVLEILRNNDGYLRDPDRSFRPDPKDAFVPRQLIGRFGLTAGARVVGSAALGKRGFKLTDVESVCDLAPAAFGERAPLKDLPAVNPDRRFRLGDGGNPSMRLVELFAPVGRGTRGLIVSPPKAGKTQLLEDIALGIHADSPETRVVALLIDERPEEVTYFRRRVPAEVLASSSDQTLEDHVRLANLTMAQVRCELECGHDVVVLIDSITRMGRAFNAHGAGSGRTMTGGLDSRALEIPRRFFGMARNIENGGSVTVIATALIDTGSRMDDLIFEEFKGTGNCEIVLNRSLAEARVFPAIDLLASGTRRDDLLYDADELDAINTLRRRGQDMTPRQAIEGLLKLMEERPTNAELLRNIG